MRLFVAVEIDPRIVQKIARSVDELRRRVDERAPRARIGWASTERLHVTVRFIGETSEARAASIASSLAPALPVEPFDVTVQGIGAFPQYGAPRVLWAGVGAGTEGLAALEREVTRRLATCGLAAEERAYRPHVTLARVREAAGLQTRPLLDGLLDCPFGTYNVNAITLFLSRPSPKGSIYVPLQSTRLRSPVFSDR